MVLGRQRVPIEKVATAGYAIQSNLVSAQDEAGVSVPCVADTSKIAPRASRIASVYADTIPVNAAWGFTRAFLSRRAAAITQDELVGCKRYGFAYCVGRKSLGQRPCRCRTGLLWCRLKDCFA